jgi:molecular chaperone DnaK (HSP70)
MELEDKLAKHRDEQRRYMQKHPEQYKESQKKYRRHYKKNNGISYRAKQHKNFVDKNGFCQMKKRNDKTIGNAISRFKKWTDEEIKMLPLFTEGELVEKLGRTLRGIQAKRHKLKKSQCIGDQNG